MRLTSVTSSQKLNAARTQGNCHSKNFPFPKAPRTKQRKRKRPGGEQTEVETNSDPSKGCQISHANYKYFHGHNIYKTEFSSEATSPSVAQRFPAFYGTRRLIAAFTGRRYLHVPWTASIMSMHLTYFLKMDLYIIFPLFLRVLCRLFRYSFPPKPCTHLSFTPYVLHGPSISFFLIGSSENCLVWSKGVKLLIPLFSPLPSHLSPLQLIYPLQDHNVEHPKPGNIHDAYPCIRGIFNLM